MFPHGEVIIKIRRLIMMLQYLDTIIAFTVIMLGVSLLITIITQMISALFGYRGINLFWGLKTERRFKSRMSLFLVETVFLGERSV
jgi:hypothetical protein